jgi:hypothetical protein
MEATITACTWCNGVHIIVTPCVLVGGYVHAPQTLPWLLQIVAYHVHACVPYPSALCCVPLDLSRPDARRYMIEAA